VSGTSQHTWDQINRRKREALMRKVAKVHIDFETRSTVDLPETGVYVYAQHPTTDAWCLAYALDDDHPKVWTPGQPFPDDLRAALAQGAEVHAHNANFEWVIWNVIMVPRYRWPKLPLEQCRCTMAMAYAMALPGSLDKAASALGLKSQKDMSGHRLMLQMARPRKIEPDGTIVWWDDADRRNRLYAYCQQDLETERELGKRIRPLSPAEQAVWVLDQKINARGVGVDEALCRKALKIVYAATADLDDRMRKTTENTVKATSNVIQLRNWIKSRGVTIPTVMVKGEKKESLAKEALADLLAEVELPDDVRIALELRREAAKTSTAKIETLLTGLSKDGRARGLLQYHAASTGRWAGRRFQPQNLPRPKLKKAEIPTALEALNTGSYEAVAMAFDEPLSVVSDCIRSLLKAAPDRDLIAGDFSNIEGRVIAWLAGEERKLKVFRDADAGVGPDSYKAVAAGIFGIKPSDIDDEDPKRQVGKVGDLSLGFAGGVGAFLKMAVNYGMKIEKYYDVIVGAADPMYVAQAKENFAKARRKPALRAFLPAEIVKLAWRDDHPMIVSFWAKCEVAVIAAIEQPGTVQRVGHLRWRVSGSFLWCQLPSGRLLCYPYPRLKKQVWVTFKDGTSVCILEEEAQELGYLDANAKEKHGVEKVEATKPKIFYRGVDSFTKRWGEIALYGGMIAQHCTQSTARDRMVFAMNLVEPAGYPLIITIHDELLAEPLKTHGSWEEFKALMERNPGWFAGCPVKVSGWRGERYRK
jgi:DNA polymerase